MLHICRRVPVAITAASLTVTCSTGGRGALPPVPEATTLGAAPLCEASAMTRSPSDPDLVLVADNERRDLLFGFRLGVGHRLESMTTLRVSGGALPDDVEALAAAGDRVVAVGSHGRNRWCERRPAKEGVTELMWRAESAGYEVVESRDHRAAMDEALTDIGACTRRLFAAPTPDRADEVCAIVLETQDRLERERCIPPLDIEGAAAVGGEVWIGLRRPRLAAGPVLLRLGREPDGAPFDGVALLDVGDRGVRAMDVADGRLWVVMGPGAPTFDASELWAFELDSLAPGRRLSGRPVLTGLPPETEGVVVDQGVAVLVIDGDEPDEAAASCSVPARQLSVELPAAAARREGRAGAGRRSSTR